MTRHAELQRKWRRETKLMLMEMKGNKCSACGFEGDPCQFDFHHPDGEPKKDRALLMNRRSIDKVLADAEPLVLLCANCHRLEHARPRSSAW